MVVVEAPLVARKARAGQFLIVRIDEHGERIPLTIADNDPTAGTVTLIFQEVGKSTMQMGELEVGDAFANVVGPLGVPSEIENYGTVVMIAGGIGIAPIYPIARALKQAGNRVISIIGARTKELLFWEDRIQSCSDELIVCTDDGSYGRKGLVTEPLSELLESDKKLARAWAIGPAIMMKMVSETTRPYQLPTVVSLNTVMIDGTGMCGGCRVELNEGWKFACVDGPEFDGHQVHWDSVLSRLKYYRAEEHLSTEYWEYQNCRLNEYFEESRKP
ncbi:MAG: sulfide/dihydroorotate dehydrogenase-like FAD/NAD-binding protein [Anaerolineales bacterium]|nr:sulfide/dihydroorotate dehydrogenase-like FAD/NAD-binding protein [Anaerolineales bacterium]